VLPVVLCSEVNVPAMKTRLSCGTTSMSQISPVLMTGVFLRGVAGTSDVWPGTGWVTWTAAAAALTGARPVTGGLAVASATADKAGRLSAATALASRPVRARERTLIWM
jgi:hypothetical protein